MKNFSLVIIIGISSTLYGAQAQGLMGKIIVEFDEERLEYFESLRDSAAFIKEANKRQQELVASGYLLANIDSINCNSKNCIAMIYAGTIYSWGKLSLANIPSDILRKAKNQNYTGQYVNPDQIINFKQILVDGAVDLGYPFASTYLDSISINNNVVNASLMLKLGPSIKYDTLTVSGSVKIKHEFLSAYLNIKPGTSYSQKEWELIETKMRLLDYCQLEEPPKIAIGNKRCYTYLNLKKINANKFDAIIGILQQPGGADLQLTGFANLDLKNIFHSGKRLKLNWRQMGASSQKLNVAYDHPNLIMSPLGLMMGFNLLKQDTTFVNREILLGTSFFLNKYRAELYASNTASFLISDQSTIDISNSNIFDYKLQYYGLTLSSDNTNKQINTSKGNSYGVNVALGSKNTQQSPSIPDSIYQNIKLSSTQYKLEGHWNYYLAMGEKYVNAVNVSGGFMRSNGLLYYNDIFRIGGLTSLRGFNELEFYASQYATVSYELQLHFNQTSNFFIFYDQGYLNNKIMDYNAFPFGFGAGMNLNTGKGLLQIVYALGKYDQQSLSLNQAKIHIGYVARF